MWVQISAGQGPAVCCWVVAQVVSVFRAEAESQHLSVSTLSAVEGDAPKTFRSILLSIEGDVEPSWLSSWVGSIQWIGLSPYRPKHKRKNWFVGLQTMMEPTKLEIRSSDLSWERMRAGGPGGQHVNTTNTAVRVTHRPTGLQAKAQEERSQKRNQSLALARLIEQIRQKERAEHSSAQHDRWKQHISLTRGNPVRTYLGKRFLRKS